MKTGIELIAEEQMNERLSELFWLLRAISERPGVELCDQRASGAREARYEIRKLVRDRIRKLKAKQGYEGAND